MKVFVYGTLKRGYYNYYRLKQSKFIDEAISYEKYALYDGGFPFAVHQDNVEGIVCLPIIGELYEIDRYTLNNLDLLEGEGSFYFRHNRPFITKSGELVQAAIYEYPRQLKQKVCPIVIVDGQSCYRWSNE